MKVLKVYDDVHQAVKVEAAKSARTTTNAASELLRWALEQLKIGKVTLRDLPSDETAAR